MALVIHPPDYMDHMDDDFDPADDWIGCAESAGICPYCGEVMLDDMEVGQGYCMTAPCWMWATGQIELAIAWECAHDFGARHREGDPKFDCPQPDVPQYAPLPQNRGRRLLWPPRGERGYVV